MAQADNATDRADGQRGLEPPSISLPKGGGAIRGIGEKFAANPVTGTGSMSVPLAASPGRSGFGPELSLSYDSGAGNGPFGFGWSLSLPSITRKTDKGLPRYLDEDESDVFVLSGAEDLVPVLGDDGTETRTVDSVEYRIDRYRPRVEGLFARIERWMNLESGEVHWRSISPDNVTSLYGKTAESRIADPDDQRRVLSWLICESHDDKGNAMVYLYAAENDEDVDRDAANERNRVRAANRYLKSIRYGNRVSRLIEPDLSDAAWLFELVFDYDEAIYEELDLDPALPEVDQHRFVEATGPPDLPWDSGQRSWSLRPDPFSSYRSGFEVRTYRRCRRVLMFHHFDELGDEPCLVRSTEFDYADLDYSKEPPIEDELAHEGSTCIASVIRRVTQSGYVRQEDGTYLKKSLPSLEFGYSKAEIQEEIQELDAESLENLPVGIDGGQYQWVDLDGEGISGVLAEQGDAWYYKPSRGQGRLGPLQTVARMPSIAALASGRQQLLDLAGDGQLDLAEFSGPTPGFHERTDDEDWESFRAFSSLPSIAWENPNLRFADLNGDGHADVLITEDDLFAWHPSLGEDGFGPASRVPLPIDEEEGPRLVFADGAQSIYLADMSGDGLTDLVRIRNGEVCYWPNLGYGRFGAKVTMDNAPSFDHPDQFDQRRIRVADIDGSGNNDIVYLCRDGVDLYFNESGNRWSGPRHLDQFPDTDNLSSVMTADLLGNGTACLVWSSPLPEAARRPMRYIDLMGGQKPHLLVTAANNLGAETHVHYATSTKFYLKDKEDGTPWVTRLPFPVHVVERVETWDRVSRNRFVTRYAYHHGYFDGIEREFGGFGMVEQWDTEEFAALSESDDVPTGENIDESTHVPPVHAKTWFHTGAYVDREHISDFFAGLGNGDGGGEYYREPGLTDDQARAQLLPDTTLPPDLAAEEEREACRALRGSILREEIYALDGTDKEPHPYTVSERDYAVRLIQARGEQRHAIFLTHPSQTIDYHYERDPADPRIAHTLVLEVDRYGNALKEVAVGYGRREPDPGLTEPDQERQSRTLITYTESGFTKPIDDPSKYLDAHRAPLPCETRTYELTGYVPNHPSGRFVASDFVREEGGGLAHAFDSEIGYEEEPTIGRQRRPIDHVRTLYRPDDCGASTGDREALLPLGRLEPLALPGESYALAFTPGLLAQAFQRGGEPLIADPASVLAGGGADRGGYLQSQLARADGRFPDEDPDDHWWVPAGRAFLSPRRGDTAAQELGHAREHFFRPHRFRDPFHSDVAPTETLVTYDAYDLLPAEIEDAVGNRVTVAERLPSGDPDPKGDGNDYRVLQPSMVTDPNGNRAAVSLDALGMVVGTAVMGKRPPVPREGDSLEGLKSDLTAAVALAHIGEPHRDADAILGAATTRLVYDLFAFQRTKDDPHPEPAALYTMARETHEADLEDGAQAKILHTFSYSDGFGREIQKKAQAESGSGPKRDAEGRIVVGPDGQPEQTQENIDPRWVGSGWTVFNNKGKPVRQYEPFFTDTHGFELEPKIGVSPLLIYDPVERVIATLHPNRTYEKVVFGAWTQASWDVNDTVKRDPASDPDVGVRFSKLPKWERSPTWYQLRSAPAHAAALAERYPEKGDRRNERRAARKAVVHEDTPTIIQLDTLGGPFLTVAHNRTVEGGPDEEYPTRVALDIEGNQREVGDAIVQGGDRQGRIVMRYAYDMLGNRVRQASMEAGERWTLADVTGQPIRAWDSRGHAIRTEYDRLRRPVRSFVRGADPADPDREFLTERALYGEHHPQAEECNLRGALYLQLDQAGVAATEEHDFKGNPRRDSRRIATEYQRAIDWQGVDSVLPDDPRAALDADALEAALAPYLEAEEFTTETTYDALDRPLQVTTPYAPTMRPSLIRHAYNEAGLLDSIDVNLHGAMIGEGPDDEPEWTPFVENIDYNAKGQRKRIDYGNGASTLYDYDRLTFRLTHLLTYRDPSTFRGDCPKPAPTGWPGCELQNLRYTYDPAGNITHIRDYAQQTIFFRNKRVEPSSDYTYDATYRLIKTTGREHLGQAGRPIPHSPHNPGRVDFLHPSDGNAMGTYTERYVYDAVGNILEMQHRGTDPQHRGWTRRYSYDEDSLLEDGTAGTTPKTSNRLSQTKVGRRQSERYDHDSHGNMTHMPHLAGSHPQRNLHWNHRDQLRQTNLAGGSTAFYTYDADGERVRKVWKQPGSVEEECIYLGGFEILRRRNGTGLTFERETLHIRDDRQRIALVETRTPATTAIEAGPAVLIRHQISDHLGSSGIELDEEARIISYEEYTPYGSTSYHAVRGQAEASKRYRYCGKERDAENGFNYHGARYLAPWLCRWTSCDPAGLSDGPHLYQYAHQSPMVATDTTGFQTSSPQTNLLTDPFVASGRYGWLHTLPGYTREHIVPGSWLNYALEDKYGGAATKAVAPRVYRNAWTSLLSNIFAAPKTALDLAHSSELRAALKAGGNIDVTDFYLRAMRNLQAGGRMSPEALAHAHETALREVATWVKGEEYVRRTAQGQPVPRNLEPLLKPGASAGSAQPSGSASGVEIVRYEKKPGNPSAPAGGVATGAAVPGERVQGGSAAGMSEQVSKPRAGLRWGAMIGGSLVLGWVESQLVMAIMPGSPREDDRRGLEAMMLVPLPPGVMLLAAVNARFMSELWGGLIYSYHYGRYESLRRLNPDAAPYELRETMQAIEDFESGNW